MGVGRPGVAFVVAMILSGVNSQGGAQVVVNGGGGLPAFPGPGREGATDLARLGPTINCAIRPLQIVEVAAPKPGVIREVLVRPGQEIAVGSPIAIFDDDLDRAALAAAEAREGMTAALDAASARREGLLRKVERLARAAERGAVSHADLEAARLELAFAEGEVGIAKDALELAGIEADQARAIVAKSVVLSPVSGVVGEDPIDPGESPSAKPIAVIYVVHPLRVEAYVPTAGLARFLGRERFEIIVNGDRTAPVPVALDHVSQVVDLSSNTQSVFFALEAPGILPGYQCMFEG